LKVGDIVICHGWDVCEGMKGFIDCIVSDPRLERNGIIWTGRYSVYGLEDGNFEKAHKHYFGDFLGAKLEETGKSMSVEDLEKYKVKHSDDKMLEEEIAIIVRNLGREKGKNEGAVDIWKELGNG
jgi:hypothetical protein